MHRQWRLAIIAVLTITAMLFPSASNVAVPVVKAATYCDWAGFVMDVTIPDGTVVAPNTPLTKTWRLKNIGTCTWTTAYALQYVNGDQMSAPSSVNLPNDVPPGQTIDVSVQMVSPPVQGHFRGNWMLKNAAGQWFGLGSTASGVFWVDINVQAPVTTAFDFTENICTAAIWYYGGGPIPCPTKPEKMYYGYVQRVENPILENGTPAGQVGLLTVPQNKYNGVIMGVYDVPDIFPGDHFQALLSCQYGATSCYVSFELDYLTPQNQLVTIWKFREKYDGLFYRADVDLSAYAYKKAKLVLVVSAYGPATGDMPLWIAPRIVRPVSSQSATFTPGPLPATSTPGPLPATSTPTLVPGVATPTSVPGGATPTSTPTSIPGIGTPTATLVPASSCDKVEFLQDISIPDGSSIAPGAPFVKTWRLKNSGTCIWTSSYSLVFVGGDQMGGPTSMPLATVYPGQIVDLNLSLIAPTAAGNYAGYWMLRNSSGGFFGIGPNGNQPFWVKISVLSANLPTSFDFAANLCSATWVSGAGYLPCPGVDGSPAGFAFKVDQPVLENGQPDARSGILESPQAVDYGWIQGIYPPMAVMPGDRFQSTLNCQYGSTSCDVFFRLDYQIDNGPINTFWAFHERYEGLTYNIDLDLNSLAGQNVKFILTILANGPSTGDRAMWVGPHIARSSGSVVPTATTAPSPTPLPTQTSVPTTMPTSIPTSTETPTAVPSATPTETSTLEPSPTPVPSDTPTPTSTP